MYKLHIITVKITHIMLNLSLAFGLLHHVFNNLPAKLYLPSHRHPSTGHLKHLNISLPAITSGHFVPKFYAFQHSSKP